MRSMPVIVIGRPAIQGVGHGSCAARKFHLRCIHARIHGKHVDSRAFAIIGVIAIEDERASSNPLQMPWRARFHAGLAFSRGRNGDNRRAWNAHGVIGSDMPGHALGGILC